MPCFGIMKRNLLIFALLLVASCDTINDCQHFDVTTSPANPVEFWPIDCDTYNQKELCGVHPKCFCAPWNCSDEIKIQFTDSASDDVNFVVISFPALSSFVSRSTSPSLPDWSTGAAPFVVLSAETSEILYVDYPFVEGYQYRITVNYTKLLSSGSLNPRVLLLRVYDDDFNFLASFTEVTPTTSTTGQGVLLFTAPEGSTKFGLESVEGSDATITIDDVTTERSVPDEFSLIIVDENGDDIESIPFDVTEVANSSSIVYNTSFIPEDLNICDQKIALEIRNTTASPDVTVSKSDCLDIRVSHPCTYLWEYRNNKNILGLVYENTSPAQTFFIRVPMTFRIEEFPEEEEVMELTQSVEVLNSQIMEKKLVEVGYVPYYFHRKLKYILKHQFITIDGQSWIKADEYKILEGNKMWPVKMGEVWLTEKNSVQRAVL